MRRRTRYVCLAGACLLLLGMGPPPVIAPTGEPAPALSLAPDLATDRALAREGLIASLEEFAEWCTRKKIFIEREKVYQTILDLDPENVTARRGLGFIKDSEGSWVATERRTELKNWDRAAVRKFPGERTKVISGYAAEMLALLEKYAESLTPEQRGDVLDEILTVDPEEPRVHAMRREVKMEERWVLEETLLARKNRAALKARVKEAIRSAPKVARVDPTPHELDFGIDWTEVLESEEVRSLGTGTPEEVRRLADAMYATRRLFNELLSIEGHWPAEFTVYALAREGEKATFLSVHPGIKDEAYREFLLRLDGSGIQGTGDYAHWAPEEQRRLDGHVRQGIGWLFAESYGVMPQHGWVHEGIGLYLTRELTGTRLTWFVRRSEGTVVEEDTALRARMLDTRTNWMNEANKILQGENAPKLGFLLGKTVNNLTTEDLLYSYVLAAFLLEARPELVPPLLRAIGNGTPSQEALPKVLGLTLSEIDALVRRWLTERH